MSPSQTKGSASEGVVGDDESIDDGPTIDLSAEAAKAAAAKGSTASKAAKGSNEAAKTGEEKLADAKPADPKVETKAAAKAAAAKEGAKEEPKEEPKPVEAAGADDAIAKKVDAEKSEARNGSAKIDADGPTVTVNEPDASESANGSDDKTEPDVGTIAVTGKKQVVLRLFGRTDVGQVREHNEDNFLVADLTKASRGLMEVDRTQAVGERGTVLGVCDGMGGAAAGEVASQLAVDIVYERMLAGEPPESRDELASRLVGAIETAGLRIFSEAKADRTRRGMGTTSTIAALMDDHLFLGQVGDSRGYLLRGDRLVQVTRDQSLVNQLIEAGQLTEEEAETFEHNNIILQALGTAETVQVDLTYVDLRRGDTLLLCSDGLSGMVRNDEIREVLRAIDDPLEACRELTDRANQAGGHDNVTVVIARFEGPGLLEPTAEDIAGLKYRKYELPEGIHPSSRPDAHTSAYPPRAMTIKSMRPPGPGKTDTDDDYQDELADAIRRVEDPVDLPREPTPSWVATMLIVSAVTCVVVAGYYLLR